MFTTNKEIIFAVVAISTVFLLLVTVICAVIFLHKKKLQTVLIQQEMIKANYEKMLLQSQIEVQEATFSALGEELHDNIGQLLSSSKMLIGVTQMNMPEVPNTLLTANETLGKAIHELRSLTKSLTKEWLEQFSFSENLLTEIERINVSKKLEIHYAFSGEMPLSAEHQIFLFRIVQEAIQNVIKHAHANNIFIEVVISKAIIEVGIRDDGTGFNMENNLNGIGIINMRHRVHFLKGAIAWKSAEQVGTEITIQIPFKNE